MFNWLYIQVNGHFDAFIENKQQMFNKVYLYVLRQAQASLTYVRKLTKGKCIKGNIRCYSVNMLCMYMV